MSGAALRRAMESRLRTEMGLRDGECKIMDDGQPAPASGILFIAVHPGNWRANEPADYYLDEFIGVDVTISLKNGHGHIDRWGEKLMGTAVDAFEFIARKVISLVHANYALLTTANGLIAGDSAKFVEPLRFVVADAKTQERGADWWGGAAKTNTPIGRSMELSFDRARRVQEIAELDPEWE